MSTLIRRVLGFFIFSIILIFNFSCDIGSDSSQIQSESIQKKEFSFNIDSINPDKVQTQEDEDIQIILPNNEKVEIIEKKIEKRKNGFTFYGYVKDKPDSSVILTVENGYMYGKLNIGKDSYYIEPINDKSFIIAKHVKGRTPTFEFDVETLNPKIIGKKSISKQSFSEIENGSKIDILVLYTQKMYQKYGNSIQALIQNFIDITNNSLKKSGVATKLNLVGTKLFLDENVQEDIDINSALFYIKDSSTVHSLREQYKADLVSLLRVFDSDIHSYCGLGFILYNLDNYFPDWQNDIQSVADAYKILGYTVVQVRPVTEANPYYCYETTFAHEVGHNLGANHDRDHSTGYGAFPYSFGHDNPGVFATIMSYDSPLIDYYSNPNLTYLGEKIGVPEGEPNSADNVKTFNQTRLIVSNYYYNNEDIKPDINISETLIRFSELSVGSQDSKTVIIKNEGNGNLNIKKILLRGINSSEYVMNNNCSSVIYPNQSCNINISFKPSSPGYKKAIIKIYSNDPDESKTIIKLRGIGR